MSAFGWTHADTDAVCAVLTRVCDEPDPRPFLQPFFEHVLELLAPTIICRADMAATLAVYASATAWYVRLLPGYEPGTYAGLSIEGHADGRSAEIAMMQMLTAAVNDDTPTLSALARAASEPATFGFAVIGLQLLAHRDVESAVVAAQVGHQQ